MEVMPFLTPVRPFHGSSLPTCRGEVLRESLVVFGALRLTCLGLRFGFKSEKKHTSFFLEKKDMREQTKVDLQNM